MTHITDIIFSPEMVRALLGGRKTMTRRHAWAEAFSKTVRAGDRLVNVAGADSTIRRALMRQTKWTKVKPGDLLWVREGYNNEPIQWHSGPTSLTYRADQDATSIEIAERHGIKWRPAIHMPRWASRLTLEVTAVKMERLQDISEEDAKAEGMQQCTAPYPCFHTGIHKEAGWPTAKEAFEDLWLRLHGADSWAANPELVVIAGKVHRVNIDKMKEAA